MSKGSLVEIPLFRISIAFMKWETNAEQLLSNCLRMGLRACGVFVIIGWGRGRRLLSGGRSEWFVRGFGVGQG